MKTIRSIGLLLLVVASVFADEPARPRIELVKDAEPAYIVLAKTEHKGVMAAAKNLQRDITKITGVTPNIVHSLGETWGKCIVLGSADCAEGKALLARVGVAVDDLTGKWEVFKYRVLNNVGGKEQVLAIAGSNVRGTIFGIYDFEQKHLGVDPFWFWADHELATRGELIFDDRVNFGPSKEPTWKYRGWTPNDHPAFMEWMESGLVQRTRYSRYMFAIHPEVFERIWEAALRLKMNMFAWYFVDIDWQPDRERLQAAVDRGLFITQHQMEGVGADTGFWNNYWAQHNPAGKPKEFSYRLHPEAFREFWSYYIKRWTEFSPQVVWEINLRGWADGPFEESSLPDGGTPQQRAEIINRALADQAQLVRKLDPNPDLEMMTTLYAEVGKFYDQGWIKLPREVTTGFSDAGMSGMSYSKKFWTEKRDPQRRYGQYFHTQYFGGGPQIAKCTPIENYLKVNMDAMFQRGDTQHMLLAMNHLRHQQIEIRGIAEMLWDYPAFKPREYLARYCRDEFGEAAAPKVAALYDAYYEKHPHTMKNDGFKTYAFYHKVMEPMFTIIANLHNIDVGTRDGFALNYDYKRETYERGIKDLGEVLDQALALRPSIPEERRGFFDYEFVDAIRLVRGLYKLSIATQDAIARLKTGDRAGALAALLDARPLTEELYAAFRDERATDKWRDWFRGGTNQDFYALYNLYQKARLRLEVDAISFVTDIEPQRHPYLGNVVTHDPARVGDAIYGSQVERHDGTLYNGSLYSLTALPLQDVFQIGGIRSVYSKWKGKGSAYAPDYGLGYRFKLQGPATVFVAKPKGKKLDWLAKEGFKATRQTMTVGHWEWPYRYRNRPPTDSIVFDFVSKQFPTGEVTLGPNATSTSQLPYIVFVQPSLLAFENFRRDAIGAAPAAWKVSGRASVVDVTDYDAEMRPSAFDLSTVPRYCPLDLRALKLEPGASAEMKFAAPATDDFVLHARLKLDQKGTLALCASDGKPAVEISLKPTGKWQNLTLRVSTAQRKYSVEVQDDTLRVAKTDNLTFLDSANGPVDRLRLTSAGDRAGLLCNAVIAWRR
ncbi:MAG: glycosyl hydrolase 115 family protein [Verrucomicrobia bacterium]|nr:glycosyl hydrolase 115 family protein [Verrucomicrobiota bacterium]